MPDRSTSGLFWPTLMTGVSLVILCGLGTWQLERKAWKEQLIAKISARVGAEPITLDAAQARIGLGEELEYARVRASGRFHHDQTLYLFAPEAGETGWHVYVPLEMASGSFVFVNRGFVSDSQRKAATKAASPLDGQVEVIGLLRLPGVQATFTPANDAARNIWYWRDLGAMAQSGRTCRHR